MTKPRTLAAKARRIRLLFLDVDGVMTDGGLYYSARGVGLKRFFAQDGYGIVRAREHGLELAIISGRRSTAVTARARDLGIKTVLQGMEDKLHSGGELLRRQGLTFDQAAFIGDDLFDLPLLEAAGLSAAPADARPEVRRRVDYVTSAGGGQGAVRELIDLILRHRGKGRPGDGDNA
jgi:3-deoxy-D-manno-octulosonate 8-phosphate phosphatase (KDO 8-P phosphatase)